MHFLNSKVFHHFLIVYGKFFNYDIYHSLIEGRNFTFIDFFRKILTAVFSNVKEENILKALNTLNKEIPKSKINIIFTFHYHTINAKGYALNELEFYFVEFFNAYEALTKATKQKSKINNILVEFNNALSHILFAFENTNTFKNNINKAKSHLYRGILDCYKEILTINPHIIKKNQAKYIKLRKKEALNIGTNEDKKKEIIKEYKLLSKKSKTSH
ncbi:MAG: hypothetical protein GXO62_02405 [Epsilonproteobacteria bacterium]|nr:hypothetical protein [Campylobacterota bacterium]